jgi:L-alanine-DL-glutamate epimerase-like enolase superfamily enzyme
VATLHYSAALGNFHMLEYQGKLMESINASLTSPLTVEGNEVGVPGGRGWA